MLQIENQEMFGKVIADALTCVELNADLNTWEKTRFVNAIAKAATKIQDDGCFMDWDSTEDCLLIWSQASNEIYTVNYTGSCQCEAFRHGFICWHRAAKRLIERYNSDMLDRWCEESKFREAMRAADAALEAATEGQRVRFDDVQILDLAA
jgi:hypothetical protein